MASPSGGLLAVDDVDDSVQADWLAGVGHQQRQDAALFRAPYGNRLTVGVHLDGAEDEEIHLRSVGDGPGRVQRV